MPAKAGRGETAAAVSLYINKVRKDHNLKANRYATGYSSGARVPFRGGNSNNGANCGAFYVNLNNDASNARWNIGAALSYPQRNIVRRAVVSSPLGENELAVSGGK